MKYLLDVNALVAFGVLPHQFHARVVAWLKAENNPALLTCSITELGFVRVLAQASTYGYTVPEAQTLLLQLKRNTIVPVNFVPDANDISRLPGWVKTSKQTTDGHLVALAVAHGAVLATLDGGIQGAYRIP
jgi:predicted nucleic acid-binding protein